MSFSKKVQEARMSYTFDDFLLTPNASYVEPKDIDTQIELGKGIKLNIPVLSAAMDTVTEAELAIAMAQEGGIGVIHRNITLERQVEEVKKVEAPSKIVETKKVDREYNPSRGNSYSVLILPLVPFM